RDEQVRAGGDAQPHLHGVELIGVVEAGGALHAQDGEIARRAAHQQAVADGEAAHAWAPLPPARGRGGGRRRPGPRRGRRRGGGGRTVEAPLGAPHRRGRRSGRGAFDPLRVENVYEPDRFRPFRGPATGGRDQRREREDRKARGGRARQHHHGVPPFL